MALPRKPAKEASEETPRAEDYLEAVYRLISDKGYATTSDVSSSLKVRPPTVTDMIHRLSDKGYLEYHRYRGMKLTPSGVKVAKSVIKRHQVISEFISMIGVDDQTAYTDTEGIEHHVHPSTLHRLERLADYLKANPSTLRAIQEFVEER
jgi:DtxR family transcriptional regulator, manganese transport regulator